MKIVRLNKTHKLFHEGYTHAVRYTNWSDGQVHVKKQCHPFMVIVPTMATGVLGGNIIGVEQPIGLV